MSTELNEQRALTKRIFADGKFAKGPGRTKLFDFMLKNLHESLPAKSIECDHFKVPMEIAETDPVRSRVALKDLRDALLRYKKENPSEKWVCELPLVKKGGCDGYQLRFRLAWHDISPATTFWAPHLRFSQNALVIGGSHLFLHDPKTNSAVRFYDFNVDLEQEATRYAFSVAHPEAYKEGLLAWHHSYLSSGEVHAYETLQRWFHDRCGVWLPRLTSRDTPEEKYQKSSAILFGRPETNKYVDKLLRSTEALHLGYRIHSTLGAIEIRNIKAIERQALASFPLSSKGILGPTPTWQRVFGLITRMPHPGGHGPMTIISADSHARVVSKIAETLTDDKLVKEILDQTGWDYEAGLPESFEMIFVVTLSPGGVEGEGKAKLLVCRP